MANGGNGLFAAKEFRKGGRLGSMLAMSVYKYKKRWTEKASDDIWQMKELLWPMIAELVLVDKKGFQDSEAMERTRRE
jgi:hypothetical protein